MMETFMHPFLGVSFYFISQNECLLSQWGNSRGVVSPNQWCSQYLVLTRLHQNQKITGREAMGTQHWFPGEVAGRPSGTRRYPVFSSLELLFLTPRNLHHKGGQFYDPWQSWHPSATKGLNDGQDGSTTSAYVHLSSNQVHRRTGILGS